MNRAPPRLQRLLLTSRTWFGIGLLPAALGGCYYDVHGDIASTGIVVSGGIACVESCSADNPDGTGVASGSAGQVAGGGVGAMRHITVEARRPDGEVLGKAALDANLVSVDSTTYSGPLILHFADDGSGRGEYFDAGVQTWVRLGNNSLHVLVPSLKHHVSANAFTEAAYRWAMAKFRTEVALDAASMNMANETVRTAVNLRLPVEYQISDITNYAQAVDANTASGELPNTHAGRYGIVVAGLAKAAVAYNGALLSPSLAFVDQFAADIADDEIINNSAELALYAYDHHVPVLIAAGIDESKLVYGATGQPAVIAAPRLCDSPLTQRVGAHWYLFYDGPLIYDGVSVFKGELKGLKSLPWDSSILAYERVENLDGQFVDGLETSYRQRNEVGEIIEYGLQDDGRRCDRDGFCDYHNYSSVYEPPRLDGTHLLDVGQTYRMRYTRTTKNNDTGEITVADIDEAIRFVGFEDLTVGAHLFRSTCKYQRVDPATGNAWMTFWTTSSGQGVRLKWTYSDPNYAALLSVESSTVNDQPVR